MDGAAVDGRGTGGLERADRLDQGAGRVDLVIDDDGGLAAHFADDVHHLGAIDVAQPSLLDDRQRCRQQLGEVAGLLCESELRDDHDVIELLGLDMRADEVDGGQLIDRDAEESLDLALVEVHREDPIRPGNGEHVRDEARGDRDPRLVLLVGAAVAVVRDDRSDAAGRCALERVDHDQQLHDRLVHRAAGGLHQENVLLANVLHHAHEDVLVGELEHLDRAELRLQVAGDPLGKRLVGVAGVDAELVGVHV